MIWLLFDWQVGNHIDVATGKWTALDSGIGGGIDSYFEYLVKGAIMFDIPELLEHFRGKIPEFFLKDHEYSFHLNYRYTRLCTYMYLWWKEIFPLRKGYLGHHYVLLSWNSLWKSHCEACEERRLVYVGTHVQRRDNSSNVYLIRCILARNSGNTLL